MKKAVVTTTVLASSTTHAERIRAGCVLKTIEAAAQHDYPIIVIDGGSPTEYIETMKTLGAHVYDQEVHGMGNARRQALSRAREYSSKGHAIVWTEPEKYPLIPELEAPVSTFIQGDYDLVMLRRVSLDSCPPEQAMAYQLIALATK